jgi:hypothetical protein
LVIIGPHLITKFVVAGMDLLAAIFQVKVLAPLLTLIKAYLISYNSVTNYGQVALMSQSEILTSFLHQELLE